ncbi:MAG TPA: cation:proton antiporter [Pyrinomonadaceae bacterium]|nr:cation:proton antiporter [Pyrinomonadaceae bacterium]
MDHLVLEIGLALALVAFAVSLAHRLGVSNVPFLILIGMAVGPHAPQIGVFDFRFIETQSLIEFMGRMGVLFLLFYLGLESNVTRLIEAGRSILAGGSLYVGINFTAGFTYGYLAGFPLRETLIIAGLTTVSSSAIVAKILFDYRRTANRETELILGITMFEDVFLAVYLSLISGIILSGASSFAGVASSGGIALGFIVGLMVLGRWATPLLNRLLRISSNEVFVVVIFACLFLLAGLGETIHVAESIGALLLGLILGETEHSERMERLIVPFRDSFGAIFFFGFGLSIDPFSLGGAMWLALGAALLSIVAVVVAGSIVGARAKLSPVGSLNTSFTLLARGEFSIIIVNLAIAGGLMTVLQPFAALYVLILASASPLLAKESERIYSLFTKVTGRLKKLFTREKKSADEEIEEVESQP